MDRTVKMARIRDRPYELHAPQPQAVPLVVASPHSGREYPSEFVAMSPLDLRTIRRLEDGYVDLIFDGAPTLGAPFLHARFPRAFVDCNREPFELDPAMFDGALPAHVNTRSPRVAAGFGTIARAVAGGKHIYRDKIPVAVAMDRIQAFYRPYHQAMRRLIERTRAAFGHCILLDCHSMPSAAGPMTPAESTAIAPASAFAAGRAGPRVDFVLGDLHGRACAPEVTDLAEATLVAQGYTVTRNNPYAGGYITQSYGRPRDGVHALQIEINRSLYMDEDVIEPTDYLNVLRAHMDELMTALGEIPAASLARRR